MSVDFPYVYISCPCTDISSLRGSQDVEGDDDERTFDPRSPRTNYSLYPPEHLLYCEDCHEIRCPRCTLEEIVCWYCPSCLFEVPSSMVKSEGNRCTRNCCNCPICTAPLAVSTLESEPGGAQSQWILTCGYCNWTSLDIDIRFDKPNNVYSQLAKIKSEHTTAKGADPSNHPQATDPDARFATLKSFYTTQLSSFPPTNPLLSSPSDYNYSSPSSLARIMSLYTSLHSSKPPTSKPLPMREALTRLEGLHLHSRTSSASTLQTLLTHGWDHTTSPAQRSSQAPPPPRFLSSLRPVPALLRTKRSKRCRTCRHILVKPEAKVQSTRYRIRLVAVNYLPRITLKPLPASAATASTTTTTTPPPPSLDLAALPPLHPLQLVLTLTNPMYDAVKITLATPRRTPGLPGHKVTVLCPQFEVGASADVWDEALGAEAKRDARSKGADVEGEGKGREAEAGKVWERGRNWTSVVLEVVCEEVGRGGGEGEGEADEDADVLEIPVFVRVEYEVEVAGEEGGAGGGGGGGRDKERMEKRELAYWCVLGVGRVAGLGG